MLEASRPLFDQLLSGREDVHLFAVNGFSRKALAFLSRKGVPVRAFIDDFAVARECEGLKVIRSDDLTGDELVVVCAMSIYPQSAIARLKSRGVTRIIDYFTFYLRFPDEVVLPEFFQEPDAVWKDIGKYEWVYSRLADEESRQCMERVMNFRLNGDLSRMQGYTENLIGAYFDPVVTWGSREVFADVGGFDGKTTVEFTKRCPAYRKVLFFEPDPNHLQKARASLRGLRDVEFINKGLGAREGKVRFEQTDGWSGKVSDAGNIEVVVTRLDRYLDAVITFVKMDVEGYEEQALAGGERLIREQHPKLAVCVYHNQAHFHAVPETVLGWWDGYKAHLRHYTEGILETVMYFIP